MSSDTSSSNIIKQPEIKKVVMFKHGMSFYVLESFVKKIAQLKLQFKLSEMDDILKSLFVADLSGDGFISTISYDASQDVNQVLLNISVRLPTTRKLLEDFLADLKGATINVSMAGKSIEGSIMGIEFSDEVQDKRYTSMPQVVLLERESLQVYRIPFIEMKKFQLLNKDIQDDLIFLLETIIARKKKDAKNVLIRCEADPSKENERQIYLSYIQEAPIWKVSYRLVLPGEDPPEETIPKGKGLLAGFGLVENQTPNDWKEIDLTLVAGMPVTFKYPIYEPQYIQRKVVPLPTKSTIGPASIEEEFDDFGTIDSLADGIGFGRSTSASRAPAKEMLAGKRDKGRFEQTFESMKDAMKKSIAVSTKDMGELFEYHIARPVSIEREQSALVPILSDEVDAKKILLYDRIIHPTNPMACVEVTNTSDLTLETGPITILIEESLAGEAMLPFLNKDDTRLLNYALEQGVIVHMEEKVEYNEIHRISLSSKYLYEYYYEDRIYTYKIQNKASSDKKLYLDHPKISGFKVLNAPGEPKETSNRWRFTVDLKPKKGTKYEIIMRHETSQSYYLANIGDDFIKDKVAFYVENDFLNDPTRKILEEIATLNNEKSDLQQELDRLHEEQDALNSDQERLRENIKVLGTTGQETKLKDRLVQKLSKQEGRYEEIHKEIEGIYKKIENIDDKVTKLLNKVKLK
ncbi:MAG: hypothetical protein ACFFCS_22125 [Candidatus Hodarchaeota archaeon]